VRIPFINEQLLVDTVSTIDHKKVLSESERMRNIPGIHLLITEDLFYYLCIAS
jgi:5'-3' exonuclease